MCTHTHRHRHTYKHTHINTQGNTTQSGKKKNRIVSFAGKSIELAINMLRKSGPIWKEIHRENLICDTEIRVMQENRSEELWEKNRTSGKRKENTRWIIGNKCDQSILHTCTNM